MRIAVIALIVSSVLASALPPAAPPAVAANPRAAPHGPNAIGAALPVAPLLSTLGGQNLTLTTGTFLAPAVTLSWSSGTGQSGYQIAAMGGFADELVFLPTPQGSALPSTATSFQDTRAFNRLVYCYSVLVLGSGATPGVVANSDVLCHMPFTGTANGGTLTIGLGQTDFAALSWTPPTGPAPNLYLVFTFSPFNPAPGAPQVLPGTQTTLIHNTNGEPTCYAVVGVGGGPQSLPDIVCAFPGMSSFGTAPLAGPTASADQWAEALQRAIVREAATSRSR